MGMCHGRIRAHETTVKSGSVSSFPKSINKFIRQTSTLLEWNISIDSELANLPTFFGLSSGELRNLSLLFDRHEIHKGNIVVRQDTLSMQLWVIASGLLVAIDEHEGIKENLGTLQPGSFFGDLALQEPVYIPITVRATTSATIFSISIETFRQFLEDNPEAKSKLTPIRHVVYYLSQMPFLKTKQHLLMNQLATLCKVKKFGIDESIWEEGDDASEVCVIMKGNVSLMSSTPNAGKVHLKNFREGGCFGELALISQTQRIDSAVSTTNGTFLLFLPKNVFESFRKLRSSIVAENFVEIVQQRSATTLKALPIFSTLVRKEVGPLKLYDMNKLTLLSQMFDFVTFKKGEVIVREGDPTDAMYVVVNGSVNLFFRSPTNGKKTLVSSIQGGQLIGEEGLISQATHQLTAVVVRKTTCLKLEARLFPRFFEVAPELRTPIMNGIRQHTVQSMIENPFFQNIFGDMAKARGKLTLLGALFEHQNNESGDIIDDGVSMDNKSRFFVILRGRALAKPVDSDSSSGHKAKETTLNLGDSFGERALFKRELRSFNVPVPARPQVVAVTSCLLLTLSSESFERSQTVMPSVAEKIIDIADREKTFREHIERAKRAASEHNLERGTAFQQALNLKKSAYFEDFDIADMKSLVTTFQREEFKAGDVIFGQGLTETRFSLIVSGSIRLEAHCDGKPSMPINVFGPGEWFGDMALFESSLMAVSVIANEDCEIMTLHHNRFRAFVKKNSTFYLSISDIPMTGSGVKSRSRSPSLAGIVPIHSRMRQQKSFSSMSDSLIQQFSLLFTSMRVESGEVIAREGDIANSFYLIIKGRVAISVLQNNEEVLLEVMEVDSWFGEISLTPGLQRSATVTAMTTTHLLVLPQKKFEQFVNFAPQVTVESFLVIVQHRIMQRLKSIPFFSPLMTKQIGPLQRFDEAKLAVLGKMFCYHCFKSGDIIVKEGDEASAFFVMVSGTATLSALRSTDGADIVFCQLKQSDFFGEASLINKAHTVSASVTAASTCVCLRLDASQFKSFLDLTPEIRDPMHQLLQKRTTAMINKISFFTNSIVENKPWSKIELLGQLFKYEMVKEDVHIIKEGEHAQKFYFIVMGEVFVSLSIREKESASNPKAPGDSSGTNAAVTKDDSIGAQDLDADAALGTCQTTPAFDSVTLPGFSEPSRTSSVETKCERESPTAKASQADVLETPKMFIVDILKHGQYFGEVALLGANQKRIASVVAKTPCVLLSLTRETFRKFMSLVPEAASAIHRICQMRQHDSKRAMSVFSALPRNKNTNRQESLRLLSTNGMEMVIDAGLEQLSEDEAADEDEAGIDTTRLNRRSTSDYVLKSRHPQLNDLPVQSEATTGEQALSNVPFFDNMPRTSRKQLAELFLEATYDVDETILNGIDACWRFWILTEGTVSVFACDDSFDCDCSLGMHQQHEHDAALLTDMTAPSFFGDEALIQKDLFVPLKIRAKTDVKLLYIASGKFFEFVASNEELAAAVDVNAKTVFGFQSLKVQLSTIPGLECLSPIRLQQLASLFICRKYAKGMEILQFGQATTGLHLVAEGVVSRSIVDANGNDVLVDTIRRAEWFGELNMPNQCNASARCTAEEDATLFILPLEALKRFLKRAPEVYITAFSCLIHSRISASFSSSELLKPLMVYPDMDNLLNMAQYVHFEAGQIIYNQGDYASSVTNTLEAGQCFGEAALLPGILNTESSNAVTSLVCIKLNRNDIQKHLEDFPTLRENLHKKLKRHFVDLIKELPLLRSAFQHDAASGCCALSDMFEIESRDTGDLIFHQGAEGSYFYIIAIGSIVTFTDANATLSDDVLTSGPEGAGERWRNEAGRKESLSLGSNRNKLVVDLLKTGQFFGEFGVLYGRHWVSAVAKNPSLLLKLSAANFGTFCKENPDAEKSIGRLAEQRQRQLQMTISSFREEQQRESIYP